MNCSCGFVSLTEGTLLSCPIFHGKPHHLLSIRRETDLVGGIPSALNNGTKIKPKGSTASTRSGATQVFTEPASQINNAPEGVWQELSSLTKIERYPPCTNKPFQLSHSGALHPIHTSNSIKPLCHVSLPQPMYMYHTHKHTHTKTWQKHLVKIVLVNYFKFWLICLLCDLFLAGIASDAMIDSMLGSQGQVLLPWEAWGGLGQGAPVSGYRAGWFTREWFVTCKHAHRTLLARTFQSFCLKVLATMYQDA